MGSRAPTNSGRNELRESLTFPDVRVELLRGTPEA